MFTPLCDTFAVRQVPRHGEAIGRVSCLPCPPEHHSGSSSVPSSFPLSLTPTRLSLLLRHRPGQHSLPLVAPSKSSRSHDADSTTRVTKNSTYP
ncbi:hypothetical protein OH76DRAFT_1398255 [Lentinus brumalis]|uniref:Uncharacterized protein n=1 Tax=Lentinus brumalis TaxID=2498619 RepID=A0A371DQL0_9APHY|nr:hypothetical protein OH76DRAFT_1407215 [Polyporus brumalis]RDX54833.1 hypothetical protein OH76DRAFT_1398255 [Polyporus brumalis]